MQFEFDEGNGAGSEGTVFSGGPVGEQCMEFAGEAVRHQVAAESDEQRLDGTNAHGIEAGAKQFVRGVRAFRMTVTLQFRKALCAVGRIRSGQDRAPLRGGGSG